MQGLKADYTIAYIYSNPPFNAYYAALIVSRLVLKACPYKAES